MSPTSPMFFCTLIFSTILASAAALALWNRIRGRRPVRPAARAALLVLCLLTAVAATGTWILPGDSRTGQPAVFTAYEDGFEQTTFHGPRSDLTGQVLVWTPPQYDEPGHRNDRFPVIMLLHGIPGSPASWLSDGNMPRAVADMMASGAVEPAVIVIPTIDPGGVDTDCSDTPGHRNATWLARDIPSLVARRFRVQTGAHGWGVAGLSTGGYCAIKLPMQYPDVFGAGAAMNPDPFEGDPAVLPDPVVREANSPFRLAKDRPDVKLFAATSTRDPLSPPSNLAALQQAVQEPTQLAAPLILDEGGHNWDTWQRMYPALFPWLSRQLSPPEPAAAAESAGPPAQVCIRLRPKDCEGL